ncbi:MAG: glycosyltransferase family 2 protein [Thermoplasmata archaeon]
MRTAASPEPEVAVVVGAFSRTAYLRRAVASVLAQTLPRDRFEVVVLTGFADEVLERELAATGIRTIRDPEPRIGRWLLHAVRTTRAPLLAFLDDDDEFEPGRLAHVVDVFRAHPEVGFYRNRVRAIDAAGNGIPPARWRTHEVDAGFDRRGDVLIPADGKVGVVDVVARETFASFNSSTMVVRRALLEGDLAPEFERTQLPDLTLLVLAVLSPGALYLDAQRLTRFRFHGENVTDGAPWLRHAVEAHSALAALARARGRNDLADWLEGLAEHYDRVHRSASIIADVGAAAPRRRVAEAVLDYVRFLGHHPRERTTSPEVWGAGLYALAYLVAPPLGRRVVLSRPGARRG